MRYSAQPRNHARKSATSALKTSSKRIEEEATGHLIGNNIVDTMTKVSKISHQNIWETVTNEHDRKAPK